MTTRPIKCNLPP